MKQFILAAAALLALSGGAAAQTRFGTEGAYPPFNYVDDAGNVGGAHGCATRIRYRQRIRFRDWIAPQWWPARAVAA